MNVRTKETDYSELPRTESTIDSEAIPIWELAARITNSVPDEEWAKLPPDLAQNFDF